MKRLMQAHLALLAVHDDGDERFKVIPLTEPIPDSWMKSFNGRSSGLTPL